MHVGRTTFSWNLPWQFMYTNMDNFMHFKCSPNFWNCRYCRRWRRSPPKNKIFKQKQFRAHTTHTSGLESMRLVNRYISRLVIGIFYSHGMQSHCVICQVELGNMKTRGVLTLVQIKIALKWPRATEKKRGKKYHQIYYDKIHEPSHIWFSLSLLVCVCVRWMFCILFHGKFGIKIKPITIMAPLSSMCLCVYMGYIVHIRFTCHNVYFSWQT